MRDGIRITPATAVVGLNTICQRLRWLRCALESAARHCPAFTCAAAAKRRHGDCNGIFAAVASRASNKNRASRPARLPPQKVAGLDPASRNKKVRANLAVRPDDRPPREFAASHPCARYASLRQRHSSAAQPK